MVSEERREFSLRLKTALADAQYDNKSPTKLARAFNLRSPAHAVNTQTARKWLAGEAIPRQEKLQILAQWLGVPVEWLRFGVVGGSEEGLPRSAGRISDEDAAFLKVLWTLDAHDQHIVRELARLLATVRKYR